MGNERIEDIPFQTPQNGVFRKMDTPDIEISVDNTYIDPSTDEIVVLFTCIDTTHEIRRSLSECFATDVDVRVTEELNIEVRGNGHTRINPIPSDLTPPTEKL